MRCWRRGPEAARGRGRFRFASLPSHEKSPPARWAAGGAQCAQRGRGRNRVRATTGSPPSEPSPGEHSRGPNRVRLWRGARAHPRLGRSPLLRAVQKRESGVPSRRPRPREWPRGDGASATGTGSIARARPARPARSGERTWRSSVAKAPTRSRGSRADFVRKFWLPGVFQAKGRISQGACRPLTARLMRGVHASK